MVRVERRLNLLERSLFAYMIADQPKRTAISVGEGELDLGALTYTASDGHLQSCSKYGVFRMAIPLALLVCEISYSSSMSEEDNLRLSSESLPQSLDLETC